MPEAVSAALPTLATAVVIGARGGLGGALVDALRAGGQYRYVLALSRSETVTSVTIPADRAGASQRIDAHIDLLDEASIAGAAAQCPALPAVRLVIVASGLLHAADGLRPEKALSGLKAESLSRLFAVNAIGPALVAKHFLPRMPREGRVVFAAISARVGSISDNRLGGWYGYRASKAALHMLLRSAAIEWSRTARESVCVGLHPGTVDTALSRPFQGSVAEGKLLTPQQSAAHLLQVLEGLGPAQTGRVFAWDGSEVPA